MDIARTARVVPSAAEASRTAKVDRVNGTGVNGSGMIT